jgi:hypothetical protein
MFNILKQAIRHLFMVYKIYIENLIEIYINLRAEYITIKKLKKVNKHNNFKQLLERWNTIDIENQVNTSSTVLFFNFPPKTIEFEESIPKINWRVKSADKNVSDTINTFLKKIKDEKFKYIGYCPNVYIYRFKLLLKFPIRELIDMIRIIDCNNKYTNLNDKCNKVIKHIQPLKEKINELHSPNKFKLTKKNIKYIEINKNTPHNNKIKYFEKYINAFIVIYKELIPYVHKKEKLINDISIGINDLTGYIKNITL